MSNFSTFWKETKFQISLEVIIGIRDHYLADIIKLETIYLAVFPKLKYSSFLLYLFVILWLGPVCPEIISRDGFFDQIKCSVLCGINCIFISYNFTWKVLQQPIEFNIFI